MAIIAPCITTETIEAFTATVQKLSPFATRVHVDISDGEFAPTFLVSEEQISWPAQWQVDVHAMVKRPSEHLARLIALRPNLIIIHAEIDEDVLAIIRQIKQSGVRVGLALLRPTVPATIADAIREADHVMIFSGDLGHYGGTASMMQVEKVRLVKDINPKVEIGWDGGVNVDNAYTIRQAGVDVLNTGSAIAESDDPTAMYELLTREINKHGVI